MKNPKRNIIILITLFLCSITINSDAQTSFSQNTETIVGVFESFDGENFTFFYTNEEDDEDIILFPKIDPEVLQKYNLSDEKFVGKTFNISFISEIETEIDEDGDEQEYIVRTIVDLKILN